jgi:ABC-type bacteriocin/lantibiotic exporters, contain an N-terminal double-glycine peptidase domain
VAPIGDSGAGKSTLLGVLLGFVQTDRGQVRLAGASLAARRGAIGCVPQSLDLMRGSVRDNLALGREVDDAEVWEAIRAVGMAEAIGASPAGLDQRLDEDGAGLSGGQRQRLSIARALLGRPAVLLLDEPTANLDAAAEASLVATLRAEARQRLVVAVAHRSALADAADLVLELVDGRVRTVARADAPTLERDR